MARPLARGTSRRRRTYCRLLGVSLALTPRSLEQAAAGLRRRLDPEFGAVDRRHPPLGAGHHVGPGHGPASVPHLHPAASAQDRLIEHDDLADQAVAAGVEVGIVAALL